MRRIMRSGWAGGMRSMGRGMMGRRRSKLAAVDG